MAGFPHDDDRDAEAREWDDALATGDPDLIDAVRDDILDRIFTRIMDDDTDYHIAGWTPTGD